MSSVPSVMYSPSPGVYAVVPVASIPFSSGLTTPLQASVANPALGFSTIFVNSSEQLSVTDSTGNTYLLLNSPATFNQNMNGHSLSGVLSESYSGAIQINKSGNNANINLGSGSASGTTSLLINTFGSSSSGANQLVIGAQNSAGAGQYIVAIGDGITAGGFGSNNIGGGNSGITNPQPHSTAIGNDIVMGAGGSGICIGDSSGLGAINNGIAIGNTAVNNIANSCLLGDLAIANVRANNSSFACDLGTSADPFKTCWLRDASPAAGSKFSQYSSVSVTNTVTETSLLTGSQVGSMLYSAGQSLGSVIRFKFGTVLTVGVADTVTVRVKVNGVTAVSAVLGGAAFAAVPGYMQVDCVVQAANLQCSMQAAQNAAGAGVTIADPAYNPAIANTFSVTAQWSAASAGDTLTVNYCYIETLFAQ